MRKLSLNRSYKSGVLNLNALLGVGMFSSSKLLKMVSLVLRFHVGCNLIGIAYSKASSFVRGGVMGIILMKKSAFSNWSSNKFKLNVATRLWGPVRCAQASAPVPVGLSCIRSCFSQTSVLLTLNRAGIPIIAGANLYVLCFGLTFASASYSLKSINSTSSTGMFMIRALIANLR